MHRSKPGLRPKLSPSRLIRVLCALALLTLACSPQPRSRLAQPSAAPAVTTRSIPLPKAAPEEAAPPPAVETPQPAAPAHAQASAAQTSSAPERSLRQEHERHAESAMAGLAAAGADDPLASLGPSGVAHGQGIGSGGAMHGRVGMARIAGSTAKAMRVARPMHAAPLAPALAPYAASPLIEGNTERYAHASDNPFELTQDTPLSTFSIDVDTASYSNVRRFLRDGVRPPADAVRIEELVNYFRYDYPAPAGDAPVSVSAEVAGAPWSDAHRLVRIGLRARSIESARAPASNLVFLIDVSGSMQSEDKLPLLKRGLSLLAARLRPEDHVAMVVYAGASGLVLPSTSGQHRDKVLAALDRLEAGGSTNGADGIRLAYRVAEQHFIAGGVNRVVLATDGDFNVGTTSEGEFVRLIEDKRKSGVFLTVLGFGRGNLNDSGMEALADHGNGNYAYIDSIAEAHKVLVREAGSTLITVAKDVKLQIEWNPTRVQSYRLIGFENRMLAARDFNDDKKDAGELGSGHTVTALYEVVLKDGQGAAHDGAREVDALRYQQDRAPSSAALSDELLAVKIRYKRPDADESQLMRHLVRDDSRAFAEASQDFRWAAAVAGFGMLLRDSEHRGDATLALVRRIAQGATGADPGGERHELLSMMKSADALGIGATAQRHAERKAQAVAQRAE